MTLLVRNFWKNAAARSVSVRVGLRTPRTAKTPPSIPAVLVPAKVAALTPREPGVISAMAMRFVKSASVIQPWEDISSMIRGIMEVPPKLVKPIFANAAKS